MPAKAAKSRAFEAGFDCYFTKPVSIDTLNALLTMRAGSR